MKRICLQKNTNNHVQNILEFHQVKMLKKERIYNRQIISNLEILHR